MSKRDSYNHGEFSWVDLVAHDLDAAKQFYANVFGWEPVLADTQGGPPYVMFNYQGEIVGGAGQMSVEMKDQGIPPMWNNYINTEDIEDTVQKAESLGATIIERPMQIFDAGRLAFLQDPTGAMVALWQKQNFHGATTVNDPGFFCWNELATRDLDKAKDFYAQLFGWEYKPNPDSPSPYDMIVNAGRENGGMMQMTEEWGDIPPHWNVYFSVADINATVEKLKNAGGSLHCDPFEIPVGKLAIAVDPQGGAFNLIELSGPAD